MEPWASAARRVTPGATNSAFLDSAGSSLMSESVLGTVVDHLQRESVVGGYAAAAEAAERLGALRSAAAAIVGSTDDDEIAVMDSATRAWATCFYSVPLRPGQTILLTGAEYASNAIAALHRARAGNAKVAYVGQDAGGGIDLEDLALHLRDDVGIVSLVHVPTNSGLVNDVRAAAQLAHDAGAFVLLDACQSVGQLAVDIADLPVDALSVTGRKWLRGPRGTGFLWVRRSSLARLSPVMLDLKGATWTGPESYQMHDSARQLEFWESNVAGLLGLHQAITEALDRGPAAIERAVRERADRLRADLSTLRGVHVRDPGLPACGIVSFSVDGAAATDVKTALHRRHVTVSVSRRPSTLMDMDRRALTEVVRASPHYFVDDDDLDRTLNAVADITSR